MTSLSIGQVVFELLSADEAVSSAVTKIFPVVTDDATAPYIFYDDEVEAKPVKGGGGVDHVEVNVSVVAASFNELSELCEKVRSALDYKSATVEDMRADCIVMTHASKATWEGDAYTRTLTFGLRAGRVRS